MLRLGPQAEKILQTKSFEEQFLIKQFLIKQFPIQKQGSTINVKLISLKIFLSQPFPFFYNFAFQY